MTAHSPADITRHLLVNLGIGSLPGSDAEWPIYVGQQSNQPDNMMALFDRQGTNDGRSMTDGEVWGHNGIQMVLRSVSHPEGWAKIGQVVETLSRQSLVEVSISSHVYLVWCFARIGDVLPLGKESPNSSRLLFSLNFLLSLA